MYSHTFLTYKLSLEMPIMTLRFFKAVQSTEVLPSTLNLLFHTLVRKAKHNFIYRKP